LVYQVIPENNIASIISLALGVGLVVALMVKPEWYVVDLAGFIVGCGAAIVLGIVESLDLTTQILRIHAPEFDPAKIASIHVGGGRVERERRALPDPVPDRPYSCPQPRLCES
jgi:polynucleotide 5'-kinase involved in rRNA processing